MPKLIRVTVSQAQVDEVKARARSRDLAPHERERLALIRRSHLGHPIPQIAAHRGPIRRALCMNERAEDDERDENGPPSHDRLHLKRRQNTGRARVSRQK